jgi:RNA polymerase sigma factor (TIGR02999 family)
MTANAQPSAAELTFEEMYAALRRIARAAMRGERSSHTLQPTALVHEYLLSLPEGLPESPADRVAVVRKAGWRMRRYLIDYARQRARNHPESVAAQRVALEAVDGDNLTVTFPDLELLDDLLRELQAANAEAAAVVEMRFFCGLKQAEVAKALELSVPTVERRWREAREWLRKRVGAE